mgnify:CR=1 FL=1
MTAPPTIAVDKSPEARVVNFPKPLIDREKMVANMMALHNPTMIMLQTATYPEVFIEMMINKIEIAAQDFKITGGFADCSNADPANRPTSILPQ